MIEIAVAAQAAFKAYSLIKSGVEGGKEIEDMGKTVFHWFEAKDNLDKAIKTEEKRKGKSLKEVSNDPLAGSVWKEAAECVEEQRRAEIQLEKIKRMYFDAGKSAVWFRIKKKAEALQRDRDAEVRKRKKKKHDNDKLVDAVLLGLGIILGGSLVIGGMVFLVLKWPF